MSDYQYYEFCSLKVSLSDNVRRKMESLSSRVKIGTHGASFVYSYGDFPADPIKILSSYFDVHFYFSNFGSFRLVFKYQANEIDVAKVKKYCFDDVIILHQKKSHVLLDVHYCDENGFGWCEGEGILPILLPVYDQIKDNNYSFLELVVKSYKMLNNEEEKIILPKKISLAEKMFLECVGI